MQILDAMDLLFLLDRGASLQRYFKHHVRLVPPVAVKICPVHRYLLAHTHLLHSIQLFAQQRINYARMLITQLFVLAFG